MAIKELRFWSWLKSRGLTQNDVAVVLNRSAAHVSKRISRVGFSPEERQQLLAWAKAGQGLTMKPKKVTMADLFEQEAA